jgi:hypothetical protein
LAFLIIFLCFTITIAWRTARTKTRDDDDSFSA